MKKRNIIREYTRKHIGCPYVWGATGERCTVRMRQAKRRQYPAQTGITDYCPALSHGLEQCAPECKHRGKLAFDCAQLVRQACKQAGINMPSGASSQWNKAACLRKGDIADMPMDEVCIVFRRTKAGKPMGHVGIYLGDGTVADARGARYGVIHKPFGSYPWTDYMLMPGMDDDITPDAQSSTPHWAQTLTTSSPMGQSTLRRGHRGLDVQRLQELLIRAGYQVDADGIFGRNTLAAVKAFQTAQEIKVDGVVGRQTWTALRGDST